MLIASRFPRHAHLMRAACAGVRSLAVEASAVKTLERGSKPRVVILGTGWGGYALTKTLNPRLFDIVVIS